MTRSHASFSRIFVVCTACLLLVPLTGAAKIHHLTILHTNDHHGHFAKFSPYGNPDVGGMAARSTLVNIVRAEVEESGGYVLLLSAGNVNIGTPESDLFDAEPDFKLMNMLGYDAMTLGNDELADLDKPVEVLLQQRVWADFPFLSANLVHKDTGTPLVDPYIIKNFDDLRIAILGLTTEETAVFLLPKLTKAGLEYRSVIEIAQALVPCLRKDADLVIALTHIGYYDLDGEGFRNPGDLKLASEVPGIDVIVGGHSETGLEHPEVVGNTLIVQAGKHGLYVGRLDLTIDSDTESITEYRYKLLPVNLKNAVDYQGKSYYMYHAQGYVEDPAVLKFVQPYLEQIDERLSQPVGETLIRLNGERELVYAQETNLANLVTDAMRAKTGAEIAFRNGGGIRASIEPGPISFRDILAVLPFGNTLVLLDMTGEQIMDVLNYAATIKPGSGGFLHTSGLTWTNNKGIPEDVTVGGVPLEFDRMYKVVVNNFLVGGGDGYTMFKDLPQFDTGFTNASALREYIMKKGAIAPKIDGRLTIVK